MWETHHYILRLHNKIRQGLVAYYQNDEAFLIKDVGGENFSLDASCMRPKHMYYSWSHVEKLTLLVCSFRERDI